MSCLDNLETVFARTDWNEFAEQKRALVHVLDDTEFLKTEETIKGLAMLVNWLDAIEVAAKMDGYQMNASDDTHRAR